MAATPPEASLAHRRVFAEFLDADNPDGAPMRRVVEMRDAGKHRLIVDLTDLRNFDNQLARRMIRNPAEYVPALQKAAEDAVRRLDPKFLQQTQSGTGDIQIGVEGPMGFHRLTPRELLSPFLNTLVCVQGIVTKCSSVRPKVVKSVHYCPTTGAFQSREYRDVTAMTGNPTPAVYPTKDDKGNILVTEYGLSKYVDHQMLAIQEMPENSPPGQLPRSIDVILEDDLVDTCKPGDRVAIYGIYKAAPGINAKGTLNGMFRTVLVANNVQQLNKEVESPRYSQADIRAIKQVAARADVWDMLAESIAPSIYGHRWIKKGLLLLLLGGVEKNLANGTHIRGDMNMMMVGDPSVAKSQLLRAVMNVAPLAISTNGRGSSGVGLTAAVTTDQDTGERRLEAGAMVLADRGIVCVDEFDKMNDADRVAIHEVMEQQTVTIAKAGIHASLNARCSVLAAANPIYGSYDHSITPTRNIALPDSLLSRFDLLFIVVDHMDADIDRHISNHVLRMHRYRTPGDDGTQAPNDKALPSYEDDDADEEEEGGVFVKFDQMLHGRTGAGLKSLVTKKFLKKYIHYARGKTPRLSEEAATEKIAQAYAEMRAQGMDPARKPESGGTLPVTARSLETIIRLSTAHAKLKLHNQVKPSDVQAALKLLDFALYHRELNEVDEKFEEEKKQRERMEREQKRKAAEEARADGAGGLDGDEDAQTAGTADLQREMRRSKRQRGPAADDTDEPIQLGDDIEEDDPIADGKADSEEASAPAGIEVPAERMTMFQQAFSEHAMAARVESIPVEDLIAAVNQRISGTPFTRAEVDVILAEMEEKNRVMYTRGVVHLI